MINYRTEKIIVEPIIIEATRLPCGYYVKYKDKGDDRLLYDEVTFSVGKNPVDGYFLGYKCYYTLVGRLERHSNAIVVGHSLAEAVEKLHTRVLNYAKGLSQREGRNIPLVDIREGQEVPVEDNIVAELAFGLK